MCLSTARIAIANRHFATRRRNLALVMLCKSPHIERLMDADTHFSLEDDGAGGQRLVLAGPLLVSTIGPIEADLQALDGPISAIDLSGVSEIDTVGAWITCRMSRAHSAGVTGASNQAKRLLDAVESAGSDGDHTVAATPVWQRVPKHWANRYSTHAPG